MLRSFRVANHKSLRDEVELLLLPAYDKSRSAVPVAGIFGANASGKSNLLDALRWLQAAVRESYAGWEPGAGVPRMPFRLDPAAATTPSLYCVEVIVDGARYTYGLSVDNDRVTEEWLYTYPHNRRRIIFERDGDGLRLGSTVADYRARGEQLARLTRDNALFLSVAAHNDLPEVQPVYQWFRLGVRFVDGGEVSEDELADWLRDEPDRRPVVELVRAADLGISDIVLDDAGTEYDALALQLALAMDDLARLDEKSDSLAQELQKATAAGALPDEAGVRGRWEAHAKARAEGVRASERFHALAHRYAALRPGAGVQFLHGEERMPLSLGEQSAGTRSWVGLVLAALETLTAGGLMVVDEVDASLHPHLTARLINLFRDAETNPGGAQLLLTTHDATLLDEDILSRDEIWFVEKEPDGGGTRLFPLTDFRPRKNENTAGRYLAGSYGAVPVLSEYRFRKAIRGGKARDAAA